MKIKKLSIIILFIMCIAKATSFGIPLNTSIIPSNYSSYNYSTVYTPYQAYFKSNSDLTKAVMVISNDYQFSFDIATSQAQWYNSSLNAIMGNSLNPLNTNATIMDNALTYPNAWSGTNLTYTLTDSEVKETLAINSTPSAVGTADFFRYKINVYYNSSLQVCFDNGTCYLHPSSVKVNTTGAITFEDANNKTVFYLPPPNVTDSVGNSVNATYFLSLNNGVDLWYLSIPKSFISTAVYPIYLDPTVTFSTGSVGNMRAAVVDDTHFGLAWDISGTKYLEFYNTNGTNSSPVITVEGSAGGTQPYDIGFSCGNSTLCAYTWYNFNSDNSKLQFFDNTGANVSPMLTIQHVVNSLQITHTFLNSSDVEVCFHSVPGENCTQYHYAGNGLTPTYVGSSMAMASVAAAGTPVRCKVDAFNSSAYVLGCGLYTAQQINVTALTTSGTVLMANTQIESTGGQINPTWVSTDNWQNFTVLWHNTITTTIRYAKYTSAGTQILAPTTVQASTGNSGDVMSGWFNSTNSLLGWYLGGTPYDFSFGNYVTAGTGTTYKVDNSSTGTTMAAISGQQAVNLRFCSANDTVNQYLVYVYGNSTSLNAWTSYYSNGTAWNGTCPAAVATTYYVATTNLCGFNTTTVAACGSGWTTTFCTAGNYYPTQACSATPTFSACQAESAANSCGVCGNCAGGADTCGAVACGTSNSYGCANVCDGQGVGAGDCHTAWANGHSCYCNSECTSGICTAGTCSAPSTWNIAFTERHAVITSGYHGNLTLMINGTNVWSVDTGNNQSAGVVSLDVSAYTMSNANVTFKLSTVGNNQGATVLINNIAITHNGYSVRFAPWTYSTSDTADFRNLTYSETQFILNYPRNNANQNQWVQYSSASLIEAPEIYTNQSSLVLNDTIYKITDGESLHLNLTVGNKGSVTDGNVYVQLYINDVLTQTSANQSISAGGTAVYQFNQTISFGSSNFYKMRLVAVPSTANEGITSNNEMTQWIIKSRPYLFFTNWNNTPVEAYKLQEPYATWRSTLTSDAATAFAVNYGSATLNEITRCNDAKEMAYYYQMTGDASYANKTVWALYNFGNGVYYGANKWEWADRTLAGNLTDSQDYNYSHGNYNVQGIEDCFIAYDTIEPYLANISALNTNHTTIRDNLARAVADLNLINKEPCSISSSSEGCGMQTFNFDDNPTHGNLKLDSMTMLGAMALLDYNGQYADLDQSPKDWLNTATQDLLNHSSHGEYAPVLTELTDAGGLYQEGAYKAYFSQYPMPAIVAYNNVFSNLLNTYPRLHGYITNEIYDTEPVFTYPHLYGEGVNNQWCFQYLTPQLLSGTEQNAMNYYIQNALLTYQSSWNLKRRYAEGCTFVTTAERMFEYNSSQSSAPYNASGSFSWFSPYPSISVFRSDSTTQATWLETTGTNESTVVGGHQHANQLSFSIWSKGAYLLVDPDNPRTIQGTLSGSGGCDMASQWSDYSTHNGITVTDNTPTLISLSRNVQSQYKDQFNLANATASTITPNIDYERMQMNITGKGYYGTPMVNPVMFNRNFLFPGHQYFIIVDEMTAGVVHNYTLAITLGSSEFVNLGDSNVENNYVNGNLTINGNSITWWNTTNPDNTNCTAGKTQLLTNVQNITWAGSSETRNSSEVSYPVNMSILMQPTMNGTQNYSAMKYYTTDSGNDADAYMPILRLNQSGQNVKFMHIYYANNQSEAKPVLTPLTVTGGAGNNYAATITKGSATDTVEIGGGESITAGNLTSNAMISLGSLNSTLSYIFLYNGSSLSWNGINQMSATNNFSTFTMNYSANNRSIIAIGTNGTNATIYTNQCDANTTVSRNGTLQTKGTAWNCINSTYLWINMTFSSPSEYDILQGTPPMIITVSLNSPASGVTNDSRIIIHSYTPAITGGTFLNCTLYSNYSGTFQAIAGNATPIMNNSLNSITFNYGQDVNQSIWNVYCWDSTGAISNYAPSNFILSILKPYAANISITPAALNAQTDAHCTVVPTAAAANCNASFSWYANGVYLPAYDSVVAGTCNTTISSTVFPAWQQNLLNGQLLVCSAQINDGSGYTAPTNSSGVNITVSVGQGGGGGGGGGGNGVPTGCVYNNPACDSGFTCRNNTCYQVPTNVTPVETPLGIPANSGFDNFFLGKVFGILNVTLIIFACLLVYVISWGVVKSEFDPKGKYRASDIGKLALLVAVVLFLIYFPSVIGGLI